MSNRNARAIVPAGVADVVPADADVVKAEGMRDEIIALGYESDDIFRRQLSILWDFYLHPNLLKAIDYESLYEMCQDPKIWRALKMRVGSKTQYYALMNLAQVNAKYPQLPWDEVDRITELTKRQGEHDVIGQLLTLADQDAPPEKARRVWDAHFNREDVPLDAAPRQRETRADEFSLSDEGIVRHGKVVVVLAPGWWKVPELVRAVSMIIHLDRTPGVLVTDDSLITVATASGGRRLGKFTSASKKADVQYLCMRARAQVVKNI